MSFRIEHENQNKSLKVQSVEDSIDDIRFTKRSPEPSYSKKPQQFYEEPEDSQRESVDDLGLDFIANPNKRIESEPDQEPEYQQSIMSERQAESDIMMQPVYSEDGEVEQLSYEEIQQQKAYYLTQLKLYADKGRFASRRLGPEHPLSDIKAEVFKIRKEIEITRGINYCRTGLMFFVGTIEMLNTTYDPTGGMVELNGWTQTVMADKEEYDEVFQELYEKYAGNVSMAPELKLICMILGSAFAFQTARFGIGGNTGPGLGNFMGMFGGKAAAKATEQPQEKKMKGPSVDTDELLRKLNEDMSDTMSSVSEKQIPEEKIIEVPTKAKRGRKPKAKN